MYEEGQQQLMDSGLGALQSKKYSKNPRGGWVGPGLSKKTNGKSSQNNPTVYMYLYFGVV